MPESVVTSSPELPTTRTLATPPPPIGPCRTLAEMPLRTRGRKISEERAGNAEAAREAALGMLDRARRTRSDLAGRLSEKGYAPAIVEQVIERLAAVGLVDDVEYARAFLAGRLARR